MLGAFVSATRVHCVVGVIMAPLESGSFSRAGSDHPRREANGESGADALLCHMQARAEAHAYRCTGDASAISRPSPDD
jgi:hypothetical protein